SSRGPWWRGGSPSVWRPSPLAASPRPEPPAGPSGEDAIDEPQQGGDRGRFEEEARRAAPQDLLLPLAPPVAGEDHHRHGHRQPPYLIEQPQAVGPGHLQVG